MTKLWNPSDGPMRVAGLISGSGSNLVKIIEDQRRLKSEEGMVPYTVEVIFTDDPTSNAQKIGEEYDINVIVRDLPEFYRRRDKPESDLEVRAEFDAQTVEDLRKFDINVTAFAGYMRIATKPLIEAFLGVNVHPANLAITNGPKRRYTGDKAVAKAILAGERQLRSTTHLVEDRVDYGKILMISPPVEVELPTDFNPSDKKQLKEVSDQNQNRLKKSGDWVIFPRTLEYIGEGFYSRDESGNLYFDGKPIPKGVMLRTA